MLNKQKEHKLKKICLIAGSTGGHAMPILGLAEELSREGFKTKVFISGSDIERKIFINSNTIKILSGKFNRYHKFKNIGGLFLIILGFIESFFYLLFYRPKLIFSKGGFLAVPVLYAAKLLRIPYFTHESDSEIGLTNKIFAKGAKRFFVGFPLELYKNEKLSNAIYVGQIIRKEFLNKEGKKEKNLTPQIFITGGSQGSRKINEIIINLLPTLLKHYIVIHQVGQTDLAEIENGLKQKISSDLWKNYHGFTFSVEKNLDAIKKSDLIIARAGANTIGEIAALSRASILIPYPYAASDHQTKNARYLEKVGAAIVIKEENLTEASLQERINYLTNNNKNLDVVGKNAHKAIRFNGLNEILIQIKKYLEE